MRSWGRHTVCILGRVARNLASEEQIWSDEIGCPGCVDCVEVVVCRDCIDVRVEPLVGWRRWRGESRCTGSCEEGQDEEGEFCGAGWLGVGEGLAGWAHGTTGEVLGAKGLITPLWDMGWDFQVRRISFVGLGAMKV